MIYIVEQNGKPTGVIQIDDAGATIAFKDEAGKDVIIRAQGSLLPALVRQG